MLPGEWSEKFEFQNRPKDYIIFSQILVSDFWYFFSLKSYYCYFFMQVQTPVTLCSGEWWSILVVRLAHSADLRSRLRHVSSAPSVAYHTGCSRVVTHPGTNPALRCLHAPKWPARPMWKTEIGRLARSPIRNTFLWAENGHTTQWQIRLQLVFEPLAPTRDILSKMGKSCWTPTMTTYQKLDFPVLLRQEPRCKLPVKIKEKIALPLICFTYKPLILKKTCPSVWAPSVKRRPRTQNGKILSARALHEHGETTEIQLEKPVVKMQNDTPKGDQEYTETCKNLRNAPCSLPISRWLSCSAHKTNVKSFPRKSSHDLSKR